METQFKYVLYVILLVCVVSFVITLTSNLSLKSIRKDLESAKERADHAQEELNKARHTINDLQADIDTMQVYVTYIQKSVRLNEARKIVAENAIRKEVEEAKEVIKVLQNDFRTDSLPRVEEVPLKAKPE